MSGLSEANFSLFDLSMYEIFLTYELLSRDIGITNSSVLEVANIEFSFFIIKRIDLKAFDAKFVCKRLTNLSRSS